MKIWQSVLGVRSIRLSDDFFQIGGDSLQAIQVNRKINSRFKLNLTLKDLLENSNFSQLSSKVHDVLKSVSLENEHISTFSIIKLKDGKEKNPLFVIHPISGFVFCYREMLEYMDRDQRVYGIQSPWVEGKINTSSLTTIEEISSQYSDFILSLHPTCPISLFGSSFGGLVAYEIAHQLKIRGHNVSLLAMADIGRPNHPLLKVSNNREALVKIIELFKGSTCSLSKYYQLSQDKRIKILAESMNLQNLPFWQKQNIFEQTNLFCEAMINYHPTPYKGKVIFFDANVSSSKNPLLRASTTWEGYFTKGSEVYEIPGNHFSMLEKPNVESLVRLLRPHIT